MFTLSKICLSKNPVKYRVCISYHFVRQLGNTESEYADKPEYPPIEPVSWETTYRNKLKYWYEKITKLPTVEQKLVELNMPKFYGWPSAILKDRTLQPDSLDFVKFVTRTNIISHMPKHYYEDIDVDNAVDSIRSEVSDLIACHFGSGCYRLEKGYKTVKKQKRKADEAKQHNFILDLNNLLMKSLKDQTPHLSPTSVDLRPRIEGFWFVGGFDPPGVVKKRFESKEFTKCVANDPVNKAMRSSVFPALALRSGDGLPEILPLDATSEPVQPLPTPKEGDTEVQDVQIVDNQILDEQVPVKLVSEEILDPVKLYDGPANLTSARNTSAQNWGITTRRQRASIVPGFWPGVKDEYGHLFFHSRIWENERCRTSLLNPADVTSYNIFLRQKAVLAGFTQALSYGFYQGFTPVSELTYPIVQQYVSTDGHSWQFGLYQMNTCCLHSDLSTDNPRRNMLWLSDNMSLFDTVEGDSVKGLNDDVLRLLVSMYLKKGRPREDAHPYLADYKYLMHHNAPEEHKEEFQKFFLKMESSRFPNFFVPEILPWEKIYKVYFKTRPIDRKKKFFENTHAMNPYKRRLDEYTLKYIPRVRRINHKIKKWPRINSEHLFKHDWKTLKRVNKLYSDDEIAFKTMNTKKDTPPYYQGLKWSKPRAEKKPKLQI